MSAISVFVKVIGSRRIAACTRVQRIVEPATDVAFAPKNIVVV